MTFLQIKYVHVFKLRNSARNAKSEYLLSMESGGLPDDKGCDILDTQQADFHFAHQIA